MTMTSSQGQAWQDRAESAEREVARLHAVVEELRDRLPKPLGAPLPGTLSAAMAELRPAEMLRLAADMFDSKQFATARPIVDHVSRELAAWAETARSES